MHAPEQIIQTSCLCLNVKLALALDHLCYFRLFEAPLDKNRILGLQVNSMDLRKFSLGSVCLSFTAFVRAQFRYLNIDKPLERKYLISKLLDPTILPGLFTLILELLPLQFIAEKII